MIKINLKSDFQSYYLKEVGLFFKNSRTLKYKVIAKITKKSLGISLKKLLISEPLELKIQVNKLNTNKPVNFTSDKKTMIELYEKFRDSVSSKRFIRKLNIQVCPYCNRNYIFNFTKKNNQEATAQLDHFFDKNDYPYLAISMYNLVPSCSTCNQRKSSKKEDIFYPYLESFNESAKFKFMLKAVNSVDLEIKALKNNVKVDKHIEVFNLENLYNEHKDIVGELFQKREIYSDSYIDDLFKQYEGTLFKNREDLLRLITGGYMSDEDINKRPLSKLIKDISEQLELI